MARLKVKLRSHHDGVHLHPQEIYLPIISFLQPMVSKIQHRQDFKGQCHQGIMFLDAFICQFVCLFMIVLKSKMNGSYKIAYVGRV